MTGASTWATVTRPGVTLRWIRVARGLTFVVTE